MIEDPNDMRLKPGHNGKKKHYWRHRTGTCMMKFNFDFVVGSKNQPQNPRKISSYNPFGITSTEWYNLGIAKHIFVLSMHLL